MYLYAEANPVNVIDPKGLQSQCIDCIKVFFDCMSRTIIGPGWSTFTMGSGEAGTYYYTAKALQHSAARNLAYPLKSSIVRGYLAQASKFNPTVMLGTFIAAEAICLREEWECVNGK